MKPIVVSVLFFLTVAMSAQAEDALSVTPEQTWDAVQEQGDHLLFIDVRDPVEIMFIGFTDAVDRNIPFQLVDRMRWNDEKGVFAMDINEDFVAQVDAALKEKGLTRDSLIITMCRSGSARGKPSADYLLERGFTNVKYIDNGFQGSTVKDGEKKGFRVQNGWQNSGLPWSTKANPEKIYRFPASGT
ncbi:rhodanese-like domain-containing protein [Marinobacter sp. tcs-11]|uniref:rhodanese-like domain-containing protein n=1 Tax=Marinobacter sp. tcs-11 TaxID=1742860 RepID=UPI002579B161|nr:rhodanese-like domain-containing protein [Marinobacter sp. tcs-11]